MESKVIRSLGFDINIPIPYRFLRRYAKVSQCCLFIFPVVISLKNLLYGAVQQVIINELDFLFLFLEGGGGGNERGGLGTIYLHVSIVSFIYIFYTLF